MSITNIAAFGSAIPGDTNASANSIVIRDASGGVTHVAITAATINATATVNLNVAAVTTTSTIPAAAVVTADATAGDITLTLPALSSAQGREISFIKITAAHNVIIQDTTSTINGASTLTLSSQWSTKRLVAGASGWLAF